MLGGDLKLLTFSTILAHCVPFPAAGAPAIIILRGPSLYADTCCILSAALSMFALRIAPWENACFSAAFADFSCVHLDAGLPTAAAER